MYPHFILHPIIYHNIFSPALLGPQGVTLHRLHQLRPMLLLFNKTQNNFSHFSAPLEQEPNVKQIQNKARQLSLLLTLLREFVSFAFAVVLSILILFLLGSVQIHAQQWTKQTNQLDPAKKRKTETASQPVSKRTKPTAPTPAVTSSKSPKAIKSWRFNLALYTRASSFDRSHSNHARASVQQPTANGYVLGSISRLDHLS